MIRNFLLALALFFTVIHTALAVVPGGLVSSHNYASGSANSLEVTLTIEVSPPENSSYFWAQQFFTSTTIDHGGYFGIQTGGTIGSQNVGKMFIFSIWNADQAEAGPNATAQTFGGEGIGYSVRLPYQWQQGTPYRFRLEKDGGQWWKLTITPSGSAAIYLGRIHITQNVPLQTGFAAFTEYFRNINSCQSLPEARVSFSNFVYGAQAVPVNDSAPYGTCIGQGRGYIRGNAAVHEVGYLFYSGFE
jgi:Domain of unknown function (DUF3472)